MWAQPPSCSAPRCGQATQTGLAATSLALLLAAIACWQIGRRLAVDPQASDPLAEEVLLRSLLSQRDGAWSALPAPAAVWDKEDQFVLATAAWRSLGLPTDVPPNQLEVSVGDLPRVFVVEASREPSGLRLVLLREVTRERQALRAKDELLAIVGHELRTPLSSIKGYGQLMARQLATVQEQVQRLDGLIDDVMDTARAEGGRLNLRREPLSVSDFVSSACDRFCAAQPARKLEKKLDAPPQNKTHPPGPTQVKANLILNPTHPSRPQNQVNKVHESWTVRGSFQLRCRGRIRAPTPTLNPFLPPAFWRRRLPGPRAGCLGRPMFRSSFMGAGEGWRPPQPGARCAAFTVVLPSTLPLADEAGQPTELTRR